MTLLQLSHITQNTPGVRAVNVVSIVAQMATKWKPVWSKSWDEVSRSGFSVVISALQKVKTI